MYRVAVVEVGPLELGPILDRGTLIRAIRRYADEDPCPLASQQIVEIACFTRCKNPESDLGSIYCRPESPIESAIAREVMSFVPAFVDRLDITS